MASDKAEKEMEGIKRAGSAEEGDSERVSPERGEGAASVQDVRSGLSKGCGVGTCLRMPTFTLVPKAKQHLLQPHQPSKEWCPGQESLPYDTSLQASRQ